MSRASLTQALTEQAFMGTSFVESLQEDYIITRMKAAWDMTNYNPVTADIDRRILAACIKRITKRRKIQKIMLSDKLNVV